MKKKFAVLTSGWSIDFLTVFLEGLQSAAEENNIDLYIFTVYKYAEPNGDSNTTGFAIFDAIDYKKFDGIIIMPNLFNDDERVKIEHKRILESGVPAVSINQKLDGIHFINSDNHNTYKDLVKHLIEQHYLSDFAFIGGPIGNPGAESNYLAFKEALEEKDIPINPDNIYLDGDWSYKFGYEQATKILSKDRIPEAIVCVNDWAALAACNVAEINGFDIPDDVMIVGFDNISFASTTIPSISTVDMNGFLMGVEAINILLEKPSKITTKTIPAKIHLRQSCGCITDITKKQIKYSQCYFQEIDKSQRFASQLRHMEDVFITTDSLDELCNCLQEYFKKRHFFEGPDFAILIKDDVVNSLRNLKEKQKQSISYGKIMNILVNLQDGVPAERGIIDTAQLIPKNMMSEKSCIYLFLPIFSQTYLHGYYVSKNFLHLLDNKSAYNWTRNIGSAIEKFRQTSVYRIMSEELRIISTKDALSGLLNRTGMETYAINLFENNIKENNKTEIIFIDINNMKIINDKYGHLHGDLAVKTVAESIRTAIPENYLAIRYGGDEFVVIGKFNSTVKDVSQTIKDDLMNRTTKMSLPYALTISSGQKIFNSDYDLNLSKAIDEVDELMYKNKSKYHGK